MNILKYPDPRLNTVCEEVDKIDSSISKIANELISVLRKSRKPLHGLAANQLSFNKRIAVLKTFQNFFVMINPSIIRSKLTVPSIEVCASLPGVIRLKKRKLWIKIKYLGLDNKIHKRSFFGATSFTVQQEIDHLNGKLITN